MRLHFRCPCGAICNVPTTAISKAGECPTCGKIVVVPTTAIIVSDAPPAGGILIPHPRWTPLPGTMTAAAPPPVSSVAVAELEMEIENETVAEVDEIPAELLTDDGDVLEAAAELDEADLPSDAGDDAADDVADEAPAKPKDDTRTLPAGLRPLAPNAPTPKPPGRKGSGKTAQFSSRRANAARTSPVPSRKSPAPSQALRTSPVPSRKSPAPSQALRTSPVPSRESPAPSQAMRVSPTATKAIRKSSVPAEALGTVSPTSSKAVGRSSSKSKPAMPTAAHPSGRKSRKDMGGKRQLRGPEKKSKKGIVLLGLLLILGGGGAAVYFVPSLRAQAEELYTAHLAKYIQGDAGDDSSDGSGLTDDTTADDATAPDDTDTVQGDDATTPDASDMTADSTTDDATTPDGTTPDTTTADATADATTTDTQDDSATTTVAGGGDDEPTTYEFTDIDEAMSGIKALTKRGKHAAAARMAGAALEHFAGDPKAGALEALQGEAAKTARLRAIADQFEIDIVKIAELREAGELDEALRYTREALERTREDELRAGKLERLVNSMQEKMDVIIAERKAAVAAKKQDATLAAAEEALSAGNYDEALESFETAKGLGAEVEERITLVQFKKLAVQADAAREAGEREKAVELYQKALAIMKDEEASARLASLQRSDRVERMLADIEASIAAGRAVTARKVLDSFAEEAKGDMAAKVPDLKSRIDKLERLNELVARAARESIKERWPAALKIAEEALELDPKHKGAVDMAAKARRTIAKPISEVASSIFMKFVLVPAGRFEMGSGGGARDERPVHPVDVSGFYVGVNEVTNAEYELFDPKHKDKRQVEADKDTHPVSMVTWDEAVAFCKWLTKKDGVEYRLPTEAEWERAALGEGGTQYPWGNRPPVDGKVARANHNAGARAAWRRDRFKLAAPVGSYENGDSPFGAKDMAGNIAEWCADWYEGSYYKKSPGADPQGPEKGKLRVIRGGSYETTAEDLHTTARGSQSPKQALPTIGFRMVRALFPE